MIIVAYLVAYTKYLSNIVPREEQLMCIMAIIYKISIGAMYYVFMNNLLPKCVYSYPTSNIYWKWEGFERFHMTIPTRSPAHY